MKFDGRKLSHQKREQIRIDAVLRVEKGESPEAVIKEIGFHRSAIYQWLSKYRKGGFDALKAGKITGRPTKLTEPQIKEISDIVVHEIPIFHGYKFGVWNRKIIKKLIHDRYKTNLSVSSINCLLKRLGLTPPKPLSHRKDKLRIEQWLKKEYPQIRKKAHREKAAIYFFTLRPRVASAYHIGEHDEIMLAINARGDARFWVNTDYSLTDEEFTFFLEMLILGIENPIYLILDDHPIYRSALVSEFVQDTEGKLRLFFLPL